MTDIAEMRRSLELPRADSSPDLSSLEATYGVGATSFWNALLEEAGMGEGRLKSRPGRAIELYGDAIARHAPSGAIALSVLDSRGEFRHLSFAELDGAAGACSAAWSAEGLVAGQVLVLALPMGMTWLIAFAAALRLGLTVSCLGSLSEDALTVRLRALDPKRIVFDSDGPAPPAEFAQRALLVVRSGRGHAPPPHAYPPQRPFAKLFSPARAPLLRATPLSAETALLWALRDARFAYRIGPNEGLALPGFTLEQYQPAAILATLLAGARFVELPVACAERAPKSLLQPFITSLGVSPALRDSLRRAPAGPMPNLRAWFRAVDEPLDWPAWQDFVVKNGLEKLATSNLLVDAASGGALLISAGRPGVASAFALPSPGVPFVLSDLSTQAKSSTGCGVFSVGAEPDPENPGWFLLVKRGPEYLYGSSVLARRAGRLYSEQEVVDCVSALPGVDGACIVPVSSNEPGTGWTFVLLLFAGTLPERAHEGLAREAALAIRTRLGSDFAPDQLLVLPLLARVSDRKLDADWCRRQYYAGFLPRKRNLPVFQRLTALRAALQRGSEDVR